MHLKSMNFIILKFISISIWFKSNKIENLSKQKKKNQPPKQNEPTTNPKKPRTNQRPTVGRIDSHRTKARESHPFSNSY